MKILKQADFGVSTSYARSFRYAGGRSGFSFPCDKNGQPKALEKPAQANFEACLTGAVDGRAVEDEGVVEYQTPWRTDAVGKCECGRKVTLDSFTNTCDCGADYNRSGQRLACRSQWGEDTGEHYADIARIK